MDTTDLEAESKKWQEWASKVSRDSDFHETVGHTARVEYSGSYRYGLMLSPDIDVHILPKLSAPVGNHHWNIDAWVLNPDKYPGDLLAERMENITEEERQAILRLKHVRRQRQLDASSIDIYLACLDHGVRTQQDYLLWADSTR